MEEELDKDVEVNDLINNKDFTHKNIFLNNHIIVSAFIDEIFNNVITQLNNEIKEAKDNFYDIIKKNIVIEEDNSKNKIIEKDNDYIDNNEEDIKINNNNEINVDKEEKLVSIIKNNDNIESLKSEINNDKIISEKEHSVGDNKNKEINEENKNKKEELCKNNELNDEQIENENKAILNNKEEDSLINVEKINNKIEDKNIIELMEKQEENKNENKEEIEVKELALKTPINDKNQQPIENINEEISCKEEKNIIEIENCNLKKKEELNENN